MNLIFLAHDRGYLLKYAIKDLIILALGRRKPIFECQILFPRKENDLKEKIFLEA